VANNKRKFSSAFKSKVALEAEKDQKITISMDGRGSVLHKNFEV